MSANALADQAHATLLTVCHQLGLDADDATLLRVRSNAVFKLRVPVIVRIATSSRAPARMPAVLQLTRELAAAGFPTVHPADDITTEQPRLVGDQTVTLWTYVPGGRPPATPAELGTVLRDLHHRHTAVELSALTDPLASIREAVHLQPNFLTSNERLWLTDRIDELTDAWNALPFELPPGLLHGDPWIDNLWRTAAGGVVLGDWDHATTGPREWDLIHTHHGVHRFGLAPAEATAFSHTYGHDLTTWSGYTALLQVRDLYATAIHIRNAPHDPFSRVEAPHRVRSLMAGLDHERWHLRPQ